MGGKRKTGHLLLRDKKLLIKTDNERFFFFFFYILYSSISILCGAVMQYINLSMQDEKLRLLVSVSEILMSLQP